MSEAKRSRLSSGQRTEIRSRWKAGQSLHEIGRAFDKPHSLRGTWRNIRFVATLPFRNHHRKTIRGIL
jgi:hypothetical protein